MLIRFIFILFCSIGLLHCAKQDLSIQYTHLSSESPKLHQLTCSLFQDETFHGEVKAVFSASGEYNPNCVQIDISNAPEKLFQTDNLFVQMYPFSFKDQGKSVFGQALDVGIYKKGNALKEEHLLSSQILDTHLVNSVKSSPRAFFRKHYFKICDEDLSSWDAMQLVVYLETEQITRDRNGKKTNEETKYAAIRTTRFLIPPFESHPAHFQKKRGDALAIYHPFIYSQKKNNLAAEDFLKKAESICESEAY